MNSLLYITDYIEGSPVIASVRYEGIIQHLTSKFDVSVVTNMNFNNYESKYSRRTLHFKTFERSLEKLSSNNGSRGHKHNPLYIWMLGKIKVAWKVVKYSKCVFVWKNRKLIKQINKIIKEENIKKVLLTVPDIYGIYIIDSICKNNNVEIITEIRDIISNKIICDNYRIALKAERVMTSISDKLIVLSDGIYNKYCDENKNIRTIMNGYNDIKNIDVTIDKNKDDNYVVYSHIGSLYKGRAVREFIIALDKKAKKNSEKKYVLQFIGFVDSDTYEIINNIECNELEIRILGTVSSEKANEYMISSDYLVILTHKSGSEYAIPGKTFDYIGAEKPIIAVTNDQPLINLVDNKFGICVGHDINDIESGLKKLEVSKYNYENKEEFSRTNQVKKIIEFIEA
ncbi:hypothetical protein CSC2_44950 [Clostridium zeae]|uniref:Glycosyltransferase n=1 Tax=Clostridium zeae TaxID=2759022 RepID=A0ABQ1EH04_9CLOT|nr:hypothetical protein [Clostridium zeae]GFZ33969.1 hypothetical protein CSC2_44950 [Clostridium zeae]